VSAITFDPCFVSNVLAVCVADTTLCVVTREQLYSCDKIRRRICRCDEHGCYCGLAKLMGQLEISYVLCSPTRIFGLLGRHSSNNVPSSQIVTLGGYPIPKTMIKKWVCPRSDQNRKWNWEYPCLRSTYRVTEVCVYQKFRDVVLDEVGRATLQQCRWHYSHTEKWKVFLRLGSGEGCKIILVFTVNDNKVVFVANMWCLILLRVDVKSIYKFGALCLA
jgi:hypothetical protein